MTARFDDTLNPRLETERRYEVIEMHLSDTNAVVPKALCGADTAHDLRDLRGYLEDRLYEVPLGTVFQDCKALAMPHAEVILEAMTQDMEEDCLVGRGGGLPPSCRQVGAGDGPEPEAGLEGCPLIHVWAFFAFGRRRFLTPPCVGPFCVGALLSGTAPVAPSLPRF